LKQWIPLLTIAVLVGGALFIFQEPSEDPEMAELEAEVEMLSEERDSLETELASYPETHELAQAVNVAEQFVRAESFEEASVFLSERADILQREGRPTGVIQFEDSHTYEWLSPEELGQRFSDFRSFHDGLILSYAADVPDVPGHHPFFMDYVLVEEGNEWRISRIAFNASN
jgi:hypothetical protein